METIRFDELNLDPRILRAVTDMGFEAASPIQAQAIPVEMEGHDMIGQAQTGTGKTAAFGIPLLMKMDPENRKTQAMILCPTRELAIQVAEELRPSCEIYVRDQDPPGIWRTGDRKADPFLKGRSPDHRRNPGTCDGPHEKKDDPHRCDPHGRSR